MSENRNDSAWRTFRALVEAADKKYARVRDLPPYERGAAQGHLFHKAFKAHMRLWKFQQENRQKLVESGLKRWEIGEIASRIGQLYFSQYMRTGEARFLLEAYVFYEAILGRKYFEVAKPNDLKVWAKELRFYARFLLVALILNHTEKVNELVERFKAVIEDCKATFRETNFREWKVVVQDIVRFVKVDAAFTSDWPLRYCPAFDSHPASIPYVARFHAKKALKFRDAILTSYHRNEVKFAELTLDTHRMLQCLEWEPSGSFYRKRSSDSVENGGFVDHSGASGIIEMNLSLDTSDSSLPPNPRKAILYHPSVTHLIAVIATVCEELPPESVVLIYLSAPGKPSQHNSSQIESSGGSSKSSKSIISSETSQERICSTSGSDVDGRKMSSNYYNGCLWFGPKGSGGSNLLYPADIIPFTRRPLFLIIDSDNSQAFKVIHGAERGEMAALFLSPLRPSFRNLSDVAQIQNRSQFTFFLAAPLLAFCQLAGLSSTDVNPAVYNDAASLLATEFGDWEVMLCKSNDLDLVWAQVLSDPFIRRLILRFIFCRAVLYFFCNPEDREDYLPLCLPDLPSSFSPESVEVHSTVVHIADKFGVSSYFHFRST